MPALFVKQIGSGYHAVLFPDSPGGSADVTGARQFETLSQLQQFCLSIGLAPSIIQGTTLPSEGLTLELSPEAASKLQASIRVQNR